VLPNDHRQDAVGWRTKSHPNGDFPPPHRDAIGGHAVQADAGEQERHDAQECRYSRQRALGHDVGANILVQRPHSRMGTRASSCVTRSRIAGARAAAGPAERTCSVREVPAYRPHRL
jgi:hypothetical protein